MRLNNILYIHEDEYNICKRVQREVFYKIPTPLRESSLVYTYKLTPTRNHIATLMTIPRICQFDENEFYNNL